MKSQKSRVVSRVSVSQPTIVAVNTSKNKNSSPSNNQELLTTTGLLNNQQPTTTPLSPQDLPGNLSLQKTRIIQSVLEKDPNEVISSIRQRYGLSGGEDGGQRIDSSRTLKSRAERNVQDMLKASLGDVYDIVKPTYTGDLSRMERRDYSSRAPDFEALEKFQKNGQQDIVDHQANTTSKSLNNSQIKEQSKLPRPTEFPRLENVNNLRRLILSERGTSEPTVEMEEVIPTTREMGIQVEEILSNTVSTLEQNTQTDSKLQSELVSVSSQTRPAPVKQIEKQTIGMQTVTTIKQDQSTETLLSIPKALVESFVQNILRDSLDELRVEHSNPLIDTSTMTLSSVLVDCGIETEQKEYSSEQSQTDSLVLVESEVQTLKMDPVLPVVVEASTCTDLAVEVSKLSLQEQQMLEQDAILKFMENKLLLAKKELK